MGNLSQRHPVQKMIDDAVRPRVAREQALQRCELSDGVDDGDASGADVCLGERQRDVRGVLVLLTDDDDARPVLK